MHEMKDAIAAARHLERNIGALLSARRRWDGRAVRLCEQANSVETLLQALLGESCWTAVRKFGRVSAKPCKPTFSSADQMLSMTSRRCPPASECLVDRASRRV